MSFFLLPSCFSKVWIGTGRSSGASLLPIKSRSPYRTVPCRAVLCHVVPCRAVPCPVVPCRALSCPVVPCRAVPSVNTSVTDHFIKKLLACWVPGSFSQFSTKLKVLHLWFGSHQSSLLPIQLASKFVGQKMPDLFLALWSKERRVFATSRLEKEMKCVKRHHNIKDCYWQHYFHHWKAGMQLVQQQDITHWLQNGTIQRQLLVGRNYGYKRSHTWLQAQSMKSLSRKERNYKDRKESTQWYNHVHLWDSLGDTTPLRMTLQTPMQFNQREFASQRREKLIWHTMYAQALGQWKFATPQLKICHLRLVQYTWEWILRLLHVIGLDFSIKLFVMVALCWMINICKMFCAMLDGKLCFWVLLRVCEDYNTTFVFSLQENPT